MDQMFNGLTEAIPSLYTKIEQNPNYLKGFDEQQFIETPLHFAARNGWMLMAVEIQRLMPSFGKKLDLNGFTPVDLALRRAHALTTAALQEGRGLTPAEVALREALFRTVRALIDVNPELVRVQGREGITPLHFAAETNDVELLDELLMTCPESINVLTIRGETAVHVVVRNRNLEALKVLCGWLARCDRSQVLGWKDREGNTILHVAASTNQPAFVTEILHKRRTLVNEKNWNGSTALDIVTGLTDNDGHVDNTRALRILRRLGAKTGPTISHPNITQYLCSDMYWEIMVKWGTDIGIGQGSETRNALLVVAVLIVGATYQGLLNPPGANDQRIFNVENTNSTTITTTAATTPATLNLNNTSTDELVYMDVSRIKYSAPFMSLTSASLVLSLGFIILLLPFGIHTYLLHMSILFLLLSHIAAMEHMLPLDSSGILMVSLFSFIYFGLFIICKVMFFTGRVYAVGKVFEGRNKFYLGYELVWIFFEKKYSSAKK